ncbi:hypothetical protein Tco_0065496 [Tanacetum coccineum]
MISSTVKSAQVEYPPRILFESKVGTIVPLKKPLDIRKFDSSSYQALGACFNPYKAFLRKDLWQAVVLFELAWLDFHELVLMDDLWSIGNHDFVVLENDAFGCLIIVVFSLDLVLDCNILQLKGWKRKFDPCCDDLSSLLKEQLLSLGGTG